MLLSGQSPPRPGSFATGRGGRLLGAIITANGDAGPNVRKRVRLVKLAFHCLKPYFRLQGVPLSSKIQQYLAVLQSTGLYSLETDALSPSQLQLLDTAGMRALRCILRMPSAYYSHITDQGLSHGDVLRTLAEKGHAVASFSQVLTRKRLQLMGHILRHPESLPYKVCFFRNTLGYNHLGSTRRRGRARPRWMEVSIATAWHRLHHGPHPAYHLVADEFFITPTIQMAMDIHGGPDRRRLGILQVHMVRTLTELVMNRAAFRRDLLYPSS